MNSKFWKKSSVAKLASLCLLLLPLCVAADNLYVSHFPSRSVSVIDTSDNSLITTITDIAPSGVAVSPDGTRLYVLDKQEGSLGNDDELHIYDTATFTLVAAVLIGNVDGDLAVSPDGSRVYINGASPGSKGVTFVDTLTNTIVDLVPLGGTPRALALSPNGSTLFVSNQSSNSIDVIDTSTAMIVANIPFGVNIFGTGIAFSPDGSRAYMSDNNSQSVYEIDAVNHLILNSMVLGQQPAGVIVSLDGTRVYVTRGGGLGPAVINASTFTLIKSLPFGGGVDMAFNQDGTVLFIGTGSSGVGVMNAVTDSFIGRLSAFNGQRIAAGASTVVFEQPVGTSGTSLTSDVTRQRKGFDSFGLAEDSAITGIHWFDTGFGPSTRTFAIAIWDDSGDFFNPPGNKLFEATANVQSTLITGTGESVFSFKPTNAIELLGSTPYWLSVQVTDTSTWNWAASSVAGNSLSLNTATADFSFQAVNLAFLLTSAAVIDSDGDGVPDDDDLCPNTTGNPVDAAGCSDAQVDGDSDGFCDVDAPGGGPSGCFGTDNCPTVFNPDQVQTGNNVGGPSGDACVSPDVNIPPDSDFGNNPQIDPGVIIESGVSVGDSANVGENTQFKEDVTAGDNLMTGAEVIVESGSTLGDDVTIGEHSKVEEDVIIGNGVIIGELVAIKKGVVIDDNATIDNNATIEDNAFIGAGATVGAGAKVGKGATVSPGAVVPAGVIIADGGVFP